MSNFKISLANIRSTFPVTIDDHDFIARKLGAGEELDAAAQSRRLFQLVDELDALAKNKLLKKNPTEIPPADKTKYANLTKRLGSITKDVEDIQIEQFNLSLRMLDDGGDGSKTKELIGSLTAQERNIMFKQIFADRLDEEVTPTESEIEEV